MLAEKDVEPAQVKLTKKPPLEGDYMVFRTFGKLRFMVKEERTIYCMARNSVHAKKKFHEELWHRYFDKAIQEAVNSEEE